MRIVIVGAGFTGIQLAKTLANEKNSVILIDKNDETLRHVANRIDCTTIAADGNNLNTLEEAQIQKADALICLTDSDEVNMITCSLVDSIYPDILKIARVRNYAYYEKTALAKKSHANTFTGKHRPLYGIDYMINPDVEAADAIVKAVENGAISNVFTFGNSNMQIFGIEIKPESIFAGHKLMELRSLCQEQMLVCYVEKDGITSLPDGNTIMEPYSNLGILADKDSIQKIYGLCGENKNQLKKIAIIGAGKIGTLIASKIAEPRKFLRKNSQKVVMIDSDSTLAKAAAEKFPEIQVCNADATDEAFLKEEGIPDFDLAICATHNHELNMVLAAYLESLGVKQSMSLVTNAAFSSIAQKLGIEVTVAIRDVIVDSIMSHLRGNSVKAIHTVADGQIEVIECVIPGSSKINGKKLKEIANPGNFLVLLIKHSASLDYEIANGESSISQGDQLVLITKTDKTQKILDYFGAEND